MRALANAHIINIVAIFRLKKICLPENLFCFKFRLIINIYSFIVYASKELKNRSKHYYLFYH